jgi:hypothetical protein
VEGAEVRFDAFLTSALGGGMGGEWLNPLTARLKRVGCPPRLLGMQLCAVEFKTKALLPGIES